MFLCLAGCAGPGPHAKQELNRLIAEQNFDEAQTLLKKIKKKEYGRKNEVCYNLDMGAILHYAGKHRDSDGYLDRAETRMRELYTASARQALGTLLLNDNTMDYAGENFERALTNVFRALNWVMMGKPEEALVEARKVEVFLDGLNAGSERKRFYNDDAFARYLDSLLYEDQGKTDDARISLEAARKAYAFYSMDYNTPMPPLSGPSLGPGEGELVFIHYNGVSPRKISKTFQASWNQGLAAVNLAREDGDPAAGDPRFLNALNAIAWGNAITISYPEYVQDRYSISDSELMSEGRGAPTHLAEDISAIAIKDLRDRMALIKTRAVARAMIKYVLGKAMTDQTEKKYGKDSWQAALTRVGVNVVSASTEIADTRSWAALPSQVRLARMKFLEGKHDVTVLFKDAGGMVIDSHTFKDVFIASGRRTYLSWRTAQ